jgi:hypothetical protein
MAVILPSTYTDGTAVCTNGSPDVVGTGTMWLNTILPGDFFWSPSGESVRVLTVVDNTHITLAYDWPGATQATGAYEIRFQSDQGRVQETTRQLLERMQSGNLYAFAGLSATTDTVPYFTGPGAMGLLSKQDLINGVHFDSQVDTLSDRDDYDNEATGFVVLVSDMGDGRSAVFTKLSVAVGDWSAPAFITGPRGMTWRGTWSGATTYHEDDAVFYNGAAFIALASNTNVTPVAGATWGQLVSRGATGLTGMNPRGTYSAVTAYVATDAVLYNGSTFVALQSTTGNAPPTLPTTSNAYWQLVAIKGIDGTGTGDVVGPNGVPDGNAAMFDTTTGKLIKAATPSEFRTWLGQTAATVSFNNAIANLPGNPATVQAAIEAVTTAGGKNDSIFALEIADIKGQRQGMNGGVADAFDDQTGVVYGNGGIYPTTISILHLDGTNGSTAIIDSSLSPKTWNVAGNAQISTAQSKFGGASLLLDGTGDAIAVPFPSEFAVGTGDYTVDFWYRPAAVGVQQVIFEPRSAAVPNNPVIFVSSANLFIFNTNGAIRITGTTVITAGTWYHVAVSRVAGTTRMFINGVQEGVSYTDPTNIGASATIFVGFAYDASTGTNGYIDEFRLSKAGLYPANFVPATAPYFIDPAGTVNATYDAANDYFAPALSGTGIDANTLAILHLDGTNGSTVFTDSNAVTARTWTVTGNAQISTAQSKFGGASLYCDGTGDYILTTATPNLAFGTGDFTVDLWVRPFATVTAISGLWESRNGVNLNNPLIALSAAGLVTVYAGGLLRITGTTVFAAGVWNHVALVKSSGQLRMYVNGTQEGATYTDPNSYVAAACVIGAGYDGSSGFNGYFDEFRISNVARWTANFTPPTNPYVAPVVYTADLTSSAQAISGGDDPSGGGATFAKGKAFDGDVSVGTGWASSQIGTGVALQAYIGQDLGTARAIRRINIVQNLAAANSISSVLVRYSDDNGTYTTAVTLPITFGSAVQSFDIPDVGAHRYWIIVANANPTVGSAVWGMTEIEMMEIASTNYSNMALVSIDYTAPTVPGTARVAVQLSGAVAFTPNTDFSVDVSRDGGTTWSTATLSLTMNYNGIRMYEGAVSVSGQPSGTAMKWRMKSLTNKNVIASGVALQWS